MLLTWETMSGNVASEGGNAEDGRTSSTLQWKTNAYHSTSSVFVSTHRRGTLFALHTAVFVVQIMFDLGIVPGSWILCRAYRGAEGAEDHLDIAILRKISNLSSLGFIV